jgi:hemerythrin-like metal-binding protein
MSTTAHFEWTPNMSVGESTIDAQHQKLLSQLNTVIDAMALGSNSAEVANALKFFEQYVNEHLAYEETYMRRHEYAELDAHKKAHEGFRRKYAEFKKQFDSGTTPFLLLVDMEGFLGQWWIEHIGHEDRKYYLAFKDSPKDGE